MVKYYIIYKMLKYTTVFYYVGSFHKDFLHNCFIQGKDKKIDNLSTVLSSAPVIGLPKYVLDLRLYSYTAVIFTFAECYNISHSSPFCRIH